jgi:hypothetical protein
MLVRQAESHLEKEKFEVELDLEKEKLEMELKQTNREAWGIPVHTQTDVYDKKFEETEELKAEKDSEVGALMNQLESLTLSTGSQTCVKMADEHSDSSQLTKARDKIPRLENGPLEMQKCITEYKSELHSQREEAKEQIINSSESESCVQSQKAKEGGFRRDQPSIEEQIVNSLEGESCVQSQKAKEGGVRRDQRSIGRRILHFSMPSYSNIQARVGSWRRKSKIGGDDKKVPVPDDMLRTRNPQENSSTLKSRCHEKHIQVSADRMTYAQAPDVRLESSKAATRVWRREEKAWKNRILHSPTPDYSKVASKVGTWRKKPKIGGDEKFPVPDDVLPAMNQQGNSPALKSPCHEKHMQVKVAPDVKLEPSKATTHSMRRDQHAGGKRILQFPMPDFSNIQAKVGTWRRKSKIGGDEKIPVPDDVLPAVNQQRSSSALKSPYHEKHMQVSADRMTYAQAPDVKLESFKAATRGLRRDEKVGRNRILHSPTPDYSKVASKVGTWRKKPKIGSDEKVQVQDDILPAMNQQGSSPALKSPCHEKHMQVKVDRMTYAQAPDVKLESSKAATRVLRGDEKVGRNRILHSMKADCSKIASKMGSWRKKSQIGSDEKVPVPDDMLPEMNQQGSSPALKSPCHEKHMQVKVDRMTYAQAPDVKLQPSKAANHAMRRDQHAGRKSILHFPMPDYSNIQAKVGTWRRKSKIGGDDKKVPVPDMLPTWNQQRSPPTLKAGCPEKGIQMRVDRMTYAQAPDVKLESSKAANHGMRRDQHAGGKRILHFPMPDYSNIEAKVGTWRRKSKIGGDDKKVPVPDMLPTWNQQKSPPTLKAGCHEKGIQMRVDRMTYAQAPDVKLESSKTGTHGMRNFPMPDYSNIQAKVCTWRNTPKIGGDDKKDMLPTRNQQGSSRTLNSVCHEKRIQVRADRMIYAQAPDIKPESSKAVTRDFRRDQHGGGKRILQFPMPDYSNIQAKVATWRRE